jgi:hypothetical protein
MHSWHILAGLGGKDSNMVDKENADTLSRFRLVNFLAETKIEVPCSF